MDTLILVAAVVVPLVVAIFGDDLRKLFRRVLTTAFNFVRRKWQKVLSWYTHCEERDFVATLVNNPEEATPVLIESLFDSEEVRYWKTKGAFGNSFMLGAIWKYRGFYALLGWHVSKRDDWTWAVATPPVFLSLTGRKPSRDSHWTGSALIDAATTYVDGLIEESGVADYKPPLRFRAARRLLEFLQKPKVQRR